jgi:hypothetical protein
MVRMSEAAVDLVRRAYAALDGALGSGDHQTTVEELCDEGVVISPAGLLPESTEMHGHAGMVQFMNVQREAFEAYDVEAEELHDGKREDRPDRHLPKQGGSPRGRWSVMAPLALRRARSGTAARQRRLAITAVAITSERATRLPSATSQLKPTVLR